MTGDDGRGEAESFAERLAALAGETGLTPMAGKVLGTLLMADEPALAFGEIARRTGASRGSVSETTRLLEGLGIIERVQFAGDRRDWFRLCDDAWTQLLRKRVRTLAGLSELAASALPDGPPRDGAAAAHHARLHEMHDFFAWWRTEAMAVLERWEARRAASGARPSPPARDR